MSIKKLGIKFVTVFTIVLATAAMVTLLWNIIGHGESAIDWETSFLFAVLFGILLAWGKWREGKAKYGYEMGSSLFSLEFQSRYPICYPSY